MADVKGGNAKVVEVAEEKKLYTVNGPGSVTVKGQMFTAGSEIELSKEDAASLGDAVMIGKARPADVIARRKAGRYVVTKERSLWTEGKMQTAGFVVELSEDEARKLGDTVEPLFE
jgi:hypothetical protein